MSATVLGIFCSILEFIVFLFIVLSVGTDQLRAHDKNLDGTRDCFSMWGVKLCGPHKVNPGRLPNRGFPTAKIDRLAKCAAAFDIIGLVTSLVCFITCLTLACKCTSALIPIIFAILTIAFVIITIGCLLGIWYTKLVPGKVESRITKFYSLGYGAGLVVTAWCVQVVVLVLLIVAMCCCSGGAKQEEKKQDGDGDHAEDEQDEL